LHLLRRLQEAQAELAISYFLLRIHQPPHQAHEVSRVLPPLPLIMTITIGIHWVSRTTFSTSSSRFSSTSRFISFMRTFLFSMCFHTLSGKRMNTPSVFNGAFLFFSAEFTSRRTHILYLKIIMCG
jgi:hypothetical protein